MREMRRKKQQLTDEQAEKVILRNTYGVLSLSDAEGQPYGVPLNYVYNDGCFYFHCALDGHKMDVIKANGKASLCIVDRGTVIPETFSTDYISVIAFGSVEMIVEEEEKMRTLRLLTEALGDPDHAKQEREIASAFSRVAMIRFKADRITGKAALAMIKELDAYFPAE